MGEDDKEVVSTTVTEKDDGSIEATATTKDGSTGTGTSRDGLIDSASSKDAVDKAVEDA
jgi:hypothetical protein